jgi:hypothetical protein
MVLVTGWSLAAVTYSSAQAPARGGRYSGAYGGGMGGGGMGGGGIGGAGGNLGAMSTMGMGMPGARSPFSRGRSTRGTKAAAPSSSGPASFGGTSAGALSLPSGAGNRRQLRRNSSPVISPYLNLDPTFVNSDAGQYFMRTVPQMDANRAQQQTQRGFQGVQSEIGAQQDEFMSGLTTTGHTTSFKNLGRYFPPR